MKYNKPPLTLEQQADQLIHRGMQGDRVLMMERLKAVNYYRLSGYWYPFRQPDGTFAAGLQFDTVWQRYVFDRRLRLLVMDAIERIEVALRTALAYHHSHKHGPFAYALDPSSLPKMTSAQHREFQERLLKEKAQSQEAFVQHFEKKYGDEHDHLPVWMAVEVMVFGTVLTFYRNNSHQIKQAIASAYGMPDVVFDSWLLALNTVRNICAHHGRLWNKVLGVAPIMPRLSEYPDWHTPVKVPNNRLFGILAICRHCLLRIAPQSGWAHRLRALMTEFPDVPAAKMGFPENWEECPIWQ